MRFYGIFLSAQAKYVILFNEFKDYVSKINHTFPMGQRVYLGVVVLACSVWLVLEALLFKSLLHTGRSGPVFYLLSWSPSHLAFSLQVTWSFSIFTPSDLEAKSLGEIPSDFGCWLADILDHSNIVICILYLSKLIYRYVTLCRIFYTICTKGSQNYLHW